MGQIHSLHMKKRNLNRRFPQCPHLNLQVPQVLLYIKERTVGFTVRCNHDRSDLYGVPRVVVVRITSCNMIFVIPVIPVIFCTFRGTMACHWGGTVQSNAMALFSALVVYYLQETGFELFVTIL